MFLLYLIDFLNPTAVSFLLFILHLHYTNENYCSVRRTDDKAEWSTDLPRTPPGTECLRDFMELHIRVVFRSLLSFLCV